MIADRMEKLLEHAKSEEELLKLSRAISKDVNWSLIKEIEKLARDADRYNWQECVYGTRPIKCGEREEIIDRSYKTPSPFVKITSLPASVLSSKKMPTWTGIAFRVFVTMLKVFLMVCGGLWIALNISRFAG
jgi:hypothetical protein